MQYLVIFILAIFLSHFLTPIVRNFARKNGIMDNPNPSNPGKIHKKPTPLIGGISIYLSVLIVFFLFGGFSRELMVLSLTSTYILIVGILDDIYTLKAQPRLVIQVFTALLLVFIGGLKIEFISNPFIAIPITVLWLVGITNALNLMDNIDGATVGVSFISGIILFLLGLFNGQELPAILSLALAGACLGFLRYNSKPASIFLGDTGSLFLGFMLGSIALMETKTISSRFSNLFIFPLILGVPIFDTSLATILRIKRGKPVYLPDKSNLTFRLFGLGFTERKIVFIEYLMAAVLGFSGILLLKINSIIGYFVLVIIFTTLFLFGYRLGAVPYEEKAELRTYNFERALKNKSERQAA